MSKKKSVLMFGADPEMAITYTDGEKSYVLPPYFLRTYRGLTTYKADTKHPEFIYGDGWKVIEDGAALELAEKPSTDFRELWERTHEAVLGIETQILSQFPDDCNPKV